MKPTTVLTLSKGKLHIRGTGHAGSVTIVLGQVAANGDTRQSTYHAKAWTKADKERLPDSKHEVGEVDWDETPVFADGTLEVEATDVKGHVTSEVFHLG